MRKIVPVLVAVGLIILIAVGFVGFQVLDRYMPTKERADLAEVYDVSGDETAILYNYERQEQTGIYENGQTYLPVSWVNGHINERFYWDSTEDLLVYALPDQIVYADAETKGANGAPLLLVKDDEVYLTLGLIANYTDVQIQTFDSGDGRRVLINDWGTRNIARVKKAGSLRVKGGVKSKILTDLAKDDTVTVLDTMEKWSQVASSDGNIGYVENKRLAAAESQKFSGNFTAPVYKNTSMSGKIVLGWHQVTSQDGNNTFDSILAKTKGMNVISPTWFSLTDNNGNYRSLASKDYVAKAHAKGLQVWALLDTFSADVQPEPLLASLSTRRQLLDRGQRRVVQPQVQQQRPKARHQRAKKRRDPQGRIFHADRQKRALLPGKVRMQHTRQAVRQSRQLRIAHALRLPGSKLQRKGRVREFRGKNAKNILEPVPGSLQLPQLPFPKNHAVLSPHYRRRPMRPRRGYIRVSYHTRPRASTNAAFSGGKIPFPRRRP